MTGMLAGRVALVTGGCGGAGRAVCERFEAEGATDMANLVNWLASDEARYATGQLWVLDGGISAQVQQMRFRTTDPATIADRD